MHDEQITIRCPDCEEILEQHRAAGLLIFECSFCARIWTADELKSFYSDEIGEEVELPNSTVF